MTPCRVCFYLDATGVNSLRFTLRPRVGMHMSSPNPLKRLTGVPRMERTASRFPIDSADKRSARLHARPSLQTCARMTGTYSQKSALPNLALYLPSRQPFDNICLSFAAENLFGRPPGPFSSRARRSGAVTANRANDFVALIAHEKSEPAERALLARFENHYRWRIVLGRHFTPHPQTAAAGA
jgi:hypothetical protein